MGFYWGTANPWTPSVGIKDCFSQRLLNDTLSSMIKHSLLRALLICPIICFSANAQTEGQKGEIVGSAGFGAMTLDVFNAMRDGQSASSGGPNLDEVDGITKSKVGHTYTEIAAMKGLNTHERAVKLVQTVKSRSGGSLDSPMAQKWLEMFRAEYEKSLAKLKALN
jgi:hypothetical protein